MVFSNEAPCQNNVSIPATPACGFGPPVRCRPDAREPRRVPGGTALLDPIPRLGPDRIEPVAESKSWGTRQIIDSVTADAQHLRLFGDRRSCPPSRLALSNPALLSAPSKKSFSS